MGSDRGPLACSVRRGRPWIEEQFWSGQNQLLQSPNRAKTAAPLHASLTNRAQPSPVPVGTVVLPDGRLAAYLERQEHGALFLCGLRVSFRAGVDQRLGCVDKPSWTHARDPGLCGGFGTEQACLALCGLGSPQAVEVEQVVLSTVPGRTELQVFR